MAESIRVNPLFDRALEKAATGAFCRSIPFRKKLVAIGSLALMIFVALLSVELMESPPGIGVFLGSAAMWIYFVFYGHLTQQHAHFLQASARSKAMPIEFNFSDVGVDMDMANASTRYDWTAVDEVLALPNGTGIRVGFLIYCVEDAALPEGMNGIAFRDRLVGWKKA